MPEIDCEIVRCGHEAFCDGIIDFCGFFEPVEGFGEFGFCGGRGRGRGVIVVGAAKDEVS